MFAQHGGRECEGDSTKEGSCERVAELEREIEQLKNQKNALEEQLNCDVSKCTITPYKKCPFFLVCLSLTWMLGSNLAKAPSFLPTPRMRVTIAIRLGTPSPTTTAPAYYARQRFVGLGGY